jgi:hypothetical protein
VPDTASRRFNSSDQLSTFLHVIDAEPPSRQRGRLIRAECGRQSVAIEKFVRRRPLSQQQPDFAPQFLIPGAGFRQLRRALAGEAGLRLVIDPLDVLPALSVHCWIVVIQMLPVNSYRLARNMPPAIALP